MSAQLAALEPAAADARPRLAGTRLPTTREVEARDEFGERRLIHVPAERALAIVVDGRELVTLMTLGEAPELLALGWLRNQRLVARAAEIASIDVDDGRAEVRTRRGLDPLAVARAATRVVTTGCAQGTVFGVPGDALAGIRLPDARAARIRQSTLVALLEVMRRRDSVHRRAGSVHGCALFHGDELVVAFEDVGRHNAVDTIAGWMWMHGGAPGGVAGGDKLFYTTGRLTSEMVLKAATMGIPILVSRNGASALGLELAARLGMTLFGRAANRHFLCYGGFERFDAEPEPRSDATAVSPRAGATTP